MTLDLIDNTIRVLLDHNEFQKPDSHKPPLPRVDLAAAGATVDAFHEQDHVDSATVPGTSVIETPDGPVWLSGTAVMCQCPECEAPVSVRVWLMIADCWNCRSAIELSYPMQRAVRELSRRVAEPAAPRVPVVPPRRIPRATAPPPIPVPERPRDDGGIRRQRAVRILRDAISTLPAWFISTLVHLVLLLILALILLPWDVESISITLSTAISPDDVEGGVELVDRPEVPLEFDTPPPPDFRRVEREIREVRIAADQDARELLLDPDPITAPVDRQKVVESVTTRTGTMMTLASRDPLLRNEIVMREGGTTLSEAAVARGLRWLASVQNHDGSWSLAGYRRHENPTNRGDAAATSLALLPFLGAGQTHERGLYRETVARGLRWLIEHQKPDGDLRFGIKSDAGMYAHGQASIVLVEALAMTGDERFRTPASLAIDFIVKAQHDEGGWRYQPGQPGDTSVLGWQLMALQSARASGSGLDVDDATLTLAGYYLDLAGRSFQGRKYAEVPAGALYRYLPQENQPKPAMTAEAILCRMYLGWKRDDPRMNYAVNWLLKNALPDPDNMNIYYWYYATQVMHHYGGPQWGLWNRHLRDMLIVEQRRGGQYPGSWDPDGFEYGRSGGRVYVTALAVCTLEVYYRHLPLFRQLDLK